MSLNIRSLVIYNIRLNKANRWLYVRCKLNGNWEHFRFDIKVLNNDLNKYCIMPDRLTILKLNWIDILYLESFSIRNWRRTNIRNLLECEI